METQRVASFEKRSSQFSTKQFNQRPGGPPSELSRKRSGSATDQHNKRLKSLHSPADQNRDQHQTPTAKLASTTRGPSSLSLVPIDKVPTLPYTIETRITMNLMGQAIVCDLQEMKTDPRGLIELLKVTSSERGVWMTVGAYYRRVGNPLAAISVMNGLLELMSANNICGESQKSVYLLLAGCEADLARDAKSQQRDTSVVSKHEQNAQNWLHKDKKENALTSVPNLRDLASLKQPEIEDPKKALSKEINEPINKQISRIRVLEREVQCLRDRLASQSKKMADIRTEKHKLEEDCDYERSLRRQLQKNVEEMKKQCELARKMECFALD
ncbi:hypothetical protein BDQ17DRAFT_1343895 [Cyathus striatus]|nr:hypothetical protein BDQ17DRAFT_1343895 [Cyathus striatus]